jgi:hypothetical protein
VAQNQCLFQTSDYPGFAILSNLLYMKVAQYVVVEFPVLEL